MRTRCKRARGVSCKRARDRLRAEKFTTKIFEEKSNPQYFFQLAVASSAQGYFGAIFKQGDMR